MPKPTPIETIQRLVIASSQVGLSFEYMISLLRAGFSVEQMLKLVESGLFDPVKETEQSVPPRIM